jgi:hypothetical protein
VTTAGSFTRSESTPPSTSRPTSSAPASSLMVAAKVAWGQPSRRASICPTWFESPSTACLPMSTRSGFSRSTSALSARATSEPSSSLSLASTRNALSAPVASAWRRVLSVSFGPKVTTTTSPARVLGVAPFSVRRRAVSTAYSSKGLGFHSRPVVSMAAPPAGILILFALSGSATRFSGTRIFTGC